jgi:hypothetical protein
MLLRADENGGICKTGNKTEEIKEPSRFSWSLNPTPDAVGSGRKSSTSETSKASEPNKHEYIPFDIALRAITWSIQKGLRHRLG